MTTKQTASAMRRLADVLEAMPDCKLNDRIHHLPEAAQVGAAGMLCFIRDLLTATPKEVFNRVDMLVMLEELSGDPEIFSSSVGRMMWAEEEIS